MKASDAYIVVISNHYNPVYTNVKIMLYQHQCNVTLTLYKATKNLHQINRILSRKVSQNVPPAAFVISTLRVISIISEHFHINYYSESALGTIPFKNTLKSMNNSLKKINSQEPQFYYMDTFMD